ncbi:MAG: hypothetical protein OXI17_15590 [Gammaproteobacteria bacterium]|nr:hypothetical protein [Gammaproteobacteria bacterium]MDE0510038.1 hypothetical protein [Gammaproteobacteria bacterium]MXX05927.1 hypothetical protein [Gammaproteobacteria bacterium]MYE28886.1 hypothetical protein [Gammaproteobacteria bacterium]
MRIEPEISDVYIVLAGSFNPAIFTPAWFVLHELLPAHVADSSDTDVIHPDLAAFSTEWLSLHVTRERFTARSLRDPHIRLCDLVLRLFNEHLPHTPLNALGINRAVHFRLTSQVERDRVRRMLAPIEPWGNWGKEVGFDDHSGGMTSLTMAQFNPQGRPSGGAVNVTVEPSNVIAEGRSGIYVHVNDHYVADGDEMAGRKHLMDFLDEGFEGSVKRSDDIIDHIMSLKGAG